MNAKRVLKEPVMTAVRRHRQQLPRPDFLLVRNLWEILCQRLDLTALQLHLNLKRDLMFNLEYRS